MSDYLMHEIMELESELESIRTALENLIFTLEFERNHLSFTITSEMDAAKSVLTKVKK